MAKILVTDDEAADRLLVNTLLEDAGHDLIFATDGETAIERYVDEDVDIVVTDLVMPNLNGFRLIQELREIDSKSCIIVISGKGVEHMDRAREYGALATLTKPLDPEELLESVEHAVKLRRKLMDPWNWGD